MVATKYSYSISNDFQTNGLNARKFHDEVDASEITIPFLYMHTKGDAADAWFEDELPAGDQSILGNLVTAHDGSPSSTYRIWCNDCGDYKEAKAQSAPTNCSACAGADIEDVTSQKYALHGKPIANDMPSGYHSFQLEGHGGRKWQQHKNYVQFPSPLSTVPSSIEITNALFDGTASLIIERITKRGFVFSVGITGKSGNWGFTSVEFDWEAKA